MTPSSTALGTGAPRWEPWQREHSWLAFAQKIPGICHQFRVGVDPSRGPVNFDRVNAIGLRQTEMKPWIVC